MLKYRDCGSHNFSKRLNFLNKSEIQQSLQYNPSVAMANSSNGFVLGLESNFPNLKYAQVS